MSNKILNVFYNPISPFPERGSLGNPPRLTYRMAPNMLNDLLKLSRRLTDFSKYKFITIRPHIEYILGRYFPEKLPTVKEYSKLLISLLFNALKNVDGVKFIAGSLDKNKDDTFTHFHFILSGSLKKMEELKKIIIGKLCSQTVRNLKQSAWMLSKCTDGNIDKMIVIISDALPVIKRVILF